MHIHMYVNNIICDRISENDSKSHILFHYIYYCNMNDIAVSTLFHTITWNLCSNYQNCAINTLEIHTFK